LGGRKGRKGNEIPLRAGDRRQINIQRRGKRKWSTLNELTGILKGGKVKGKDANNQKQDATSSEQNERDWQKMRGRTKKGE